MIVRGLIERIESSATLLERNEQDPQVQNIVTEFMRILPDGLPRPDIKYVERPSERWLGLCSWRSTATTTTITLQKFIMGDEATLRRIVAHELCHHAEMLVGWKDAQEKNQNAATFVFLRKFDGATGHGISFLKWADVFNARFGASYVTKTSDEAMQKQEASKDFYLLLWLRGPQVYWSRASRPSAKQREYAEKKIESTNATEKTMKVVLSRDVDLAQGAAINAGWSYSHDPKLNEKLMKAWETGKEVSLK